MTLDNETNQSPKKRINKKYNIILLLIYNEIAIRHMENEVIF